MKCLFSPHSPQSPHFLQKFTAFTAFLTKIYPKTSTRVAVIRPNWVAHGGGGGGGGGADHLLNFDQFTTPKKNISFKFLKKEGKNTLN